MTDLQYLNILQFRVVVVVVDADFVFVVIVDFVFVSSLY